MIKKLAASVVTAAVLVSGPGRMTLEAAVQTVARPALRSAAAQGFGATAFLPRYTGGLLPSAAPIVPGVVPTLAPGSPGEALRSVVEEVERMPSGELAALTMRRAWDGGATSVGAPTSASRGVLAQPEYLYHVTTLRAWRQIQKKGYLEPHFDTWDGTLKGIFTLEKRNLYQDWTMRDGFPFKARFKKSAVEKLADYVFAKLRSERMERFVNSVLTVFGKPLQERDALVTLRIRSDPSQDEIFVRDNLFLMKVPFDAAGFRKSLKPLPEASREKYEKGVLEYILTNRISVDRISLLVSIGRTELAALKSTASPLRWAEILVPN